MTGKTILAGDIGGTKTLLALYRKDEQGNLICVREETFASADYAQFDDLLASFISPDDTVDAVCLGIAGPIIEQRCITTNLPWVIEGQALMTLFSTNKVKLLNDMEAMALGMLKSPESEMIELNAQAKSVPANRAVIAAGTGLGEALLYWDGAQYHPIATEGGHCDFSAQTEQQDQLLQYLRPFFGGRVSWERLLSGDGFSYLYDFLVTKQSAAECRLVAQSTGDRNALISKLGIEATDPTCVQVLRLFVELYGIEMGNLALKWMATGGVFIGGGIAPKILPALQTGEFLQAFMRKGRFEGLLQTVSVKVSINPNTPLLGAATYW